MPATGPERVPIGKGAMSPFLAQILRQINDAAARGSQGDPAKAIKIRDDLLEQIARPVLEGAISKATRDMARSAATGGAMAHAAAKERVGKLHLKLNELTSEAVGQMRVASAVIAAGATLGAKYMELKPGHPNDAPLHEGPFTRVGLPAAEGAGPSPYAQPPQPPRVPPAPAPPRRVTPADTWAGIPPEGDVPMLGREALKSLVPPEYLRPMPPPASATSSVIGGK